MNNYNIRVFINGNSWCALIGDDLQVGIGGFRITPVDAIRNLCDVLKGN